MHIRCRPLTRGLRGALGVVLAMQAVALVAGVGDATAAGTPNPIQSENAEPGTDLWRMSKPADDTLNQMKGYASATSVNVGDAITLFVTTNPVQAYAVDIYRMGYYQGLGGRLMQHLGPLPGISQPACPIDAATGMVACSWTPSYELTVPTTWTSGVYLAKLTNADGFQNYVTFSVRDDARRSALLFQQSVTTYQAYNNYPNDVPAGSTKPATGKSLYEYNSSNAPTSIGTVRAVKVSFDRPYSNNDGAGDFLDWEFYFIRWLEQSGYDVSYATDIDTHASPALLLNHSGFLSVGHDEYWSSEKVNNVNAALNNGVSLGFFGANAMFWQIRMEQSTSGVANRVITCYKSAALDPVQGSTTTVQFRSPPVNRPEQQVMGVMSTNQQPTGALPAPYVVANSANWVYASAGVNDGDSIPRIVGYETDRQVSSASMPAAVPGTYALLSHSPYTTVAGGSDYAQSSIYQAGSGAWVFAAGSIEWSWGLYNYNRAQFADVRIQQITANVLNRFSNGVPIPPPAKPTNLTATPSNGAVTLTWLDQSTVETHFVLQQSETPNFDSPTNIDVASGQTSYTVTGLAAGVYYFRIQAVDAGGGSPYSNTAPVSTAPYSSRVLGNPALVSYWRLGEASGSVATDAKGGANGTYRGAVTLGAPGAIINDPDTSVGFDAATAKISLPTSAPVTDFSIEGWTCLPAGWAGANSTVYGSNGTVRLLARPG
ncbi:MAG: hypothetical protein QOC66_2038, partial [Pseudonocardiales bacterium]|nr:hypothetical protein [Pseudonocardiales bacterium]